MRLTPIDESKLQVVIRHAKRDDREVVENGDGKKIKNPNYGKMRYESVKTIDVFDAKPEFLIGLIEKVLSANERK